MAKPTHRAYSRQNLEALEVLAQMIRVGRIDRKMSAQEMADRAGICDEAKLSAADRALLYGRQFLNPFAFYDAPQEIRSAGQL